MGAWIEIVKNTSAQAISVVAPLVGAWIEIRQRESITVENGVAPLVGAWIEIVLGVTDRNAHTSLLSWERGLK